MKLVNMRVNGSVQVGIKTGDGIAPLSKISGWTGGQCTVDDLIAFPDALRELQEIVAGDPETLAAATSSIDKMQFLPCVLRPTKIICIGLNYRRHALETNAPIPEFPVVFSKFANTLAAHGDDITLPTESRMVDYEAELAIVMGRRAVGVGRHEALNYVVGYCPANDVSARDLQTRTSQWLLGKTCDRFAPLGPALTTADEVGNPNKLNIRSYVNGVKRQDSSTADMIFPCDVLIEYLSSYIALEPGDVILTGTPEGVILGQPEHERKWLQDGDEVTVEIEKLGRLTNQFRN
ncbi:MAG: fumarylacetoacetate hydrolase family protein [Bacilli bacterium]